MTDGGLDVFRHYLPHPFPINKRHRSQLYDDHNPSVVIKKLSRTGKYWYYDFGNPSDSGDCFWLVERLCASRINSTELVFPQILKIIVEDMHLGLYLDSKTPLPKPAKSRPVTTTPKPTTTKMKKYSFTETPWTSLTVGFWQQYGIGLSTLQKYGVVSLATYTGQGSNGEFTLQAAENSPIFGYKREKYMKIYRPFATNRFLYGGQMPDTYCFGYEQLPPKGDWVFITGGEKDVLSLAAHGFNAVCFNSETYAIPESFVDMLALRFRHIIVMYDSDETGVKWMNEAAERLGHKITTFRLPLAGTKVEKDISDFFKDKRRCPDDFRALVVKQLDDEMSSGIELLKSCELDFENPPENSEVVIASGEVPIGIYDNLLCVSGAEGTGKSNFAAALLAGALVCEKPQTEVDSLGFSVLPNYKRKAVIHFDTEQSENHQHKNMQRALRRAGIDKRPDFFYSLKLMMHSRQKRLEIIRVALDFYHRHHGGIHLVVLDGIADLIDTANDEKGSVNLVEELFRYAGMYHTCIMCVMHVVPNGIKLRGHLGSELQRKSAAILSVERENEEVCSVKAMKVRDGSMFDVPIYLFRWSDEQGMFVKAGQKDKAEAAEDRKATTARIATAVLTGRSLGYNALRDAIAQHENIGPSTAKAYIKKMLSFNLIAKDGDQYMLTSTPQLPI